MIVQVSISPGVNDVLVLVNLVDRLEKLSGAEHKSEARIIHGEIMHRIRRLKQIKIDRA